jgi:hypothetical protein
VKELLRLGDPVRLSYIEALLTGAAIEYQVLDTNVGALMIGAIPARIMVDDEDFNQACRVLRDAGELAA